MFELELEHESEVQSTSLFLVLLVGKSLPFHCSAISCSLAVVRSLGFCGTHRPSLRP